jgi:branched-chain amino acid transport system substrate-binding protein
LFVGSGASKFADITQYPQATLGVQGPFRYEARLYARHALAKNPNARFAVISQNDDFGRDYLLGLKDVLGENTILSSPARPTKSGIRPSTRRSSS